MDKFDKLEEIERMANDSVPSMRHSDTVVKEREREENYRQATLRNMVLDVGTGGVLNSLQAVLSQLAEAAADMALAAGSVTPQSPDSEEVEFVNANHALRQARNRDAVQDAMRRVNLVEECAIRASHERTLERRNRTQGETIRVYKERWEQTTGALLLNGQKLANLQRALLQMGVSPETLTRVENQLPGEQEEQRQPATETAKIAVLPEVQL